MFEFRSRFQGFISSTRQGFAFAFMLFVFLSGSFVANSAGPSLQEESDPGAQEASVQESSGALSYSVPIETLPGPGGLVPTLALVYSSQSQEGVAGVGWHVPTGVIECSTRFGTPDLSACDQYELNGELLVGGYEESPGTFRYHTFSESFQRIRKRPDDSWEVTSPDGTRRTYGSASNSRVSGPNGTAQWVLDTVTDVFGNTIIYTYAHEPGWAYPRHVIYAGGTRNIEFVYEDKPDVSERFASGIRRYSSRRLSEVISRSGSPLGIRSRLEMNYSDSAAYSTHRSRLESVTQYGTDCLGLAARPSEQGCSGLPPQTFTYSDISETLSAQFAVDPAVELPGTFIQAAVTSSFPDVHGMTFPDSYGMTWGDVNGDGLIDVIRGDCFAPCDTAGEEGGAGVHEIYLNNGSGWDSTPDAAWSTALASLRYDAPSLKIFRRTPGAGHFPVFAAPYCEIEVASFESGVYFGNLSESHVGPAPISIVQHPNFPEQTREFAAPGNFRAADVDGDGRVDFILSARVGGAWKRAAGPDCLEPDANPEYFDEEVRVVYLNTGDPATGGWQRAGDAGHPRTRGDDPPFLGAGYSGFLHAVSMSVGGLGWAI